MVTLNLAHIWDIHVVSPEGWLTCIHLKKEIILGPSDTMIRGQHDTVSKSCRVSAVAHIRRVRLNSLILNEYQVCTSMITQFQAKTRVYSRASGYSIKQTRATAKCGGVHSTIIIVPVLINWLLRLEAALFRLYASISSKIQYSFLALNWRGAVPGMIYYIN